MYIYLELLINGIEDKRKIQMEDNYLGKIMNL